MNRSSPGLEQALQHLYRRAVHGIKLDLAAMSGLVEELDHPERACPVIHVAGTNGKGSVCAMVERVLRAAGYRTGLYTSPHLLRFHERFRVEGAPVDDETLACCLSEVEAADARASARPASRPASFFEVSTAIAFSIFRRSAVDVAVLETGLGGRLDATNVVEPLVTGITHVGYDHMVHLGETLPAIAREKAGIIKAGCPVVAGPNEPEVLEVLRRTAAEQQAPFIEASAKVVVEERDAGPDKQRFDIETPRYGRLAIDFPLLGAHQRDNLAVALAVLDTVEEQGRFSVPVEAAREGLENVAWPGRCQWLQRAPDLLVDSAHNPTGAKALATTLAELAAGRPIGLLLGFSSEKDAAGMLRELVPVAAQLWPVVLTHERAMEADGTREAFQAAGWEGEPAGLPEALEEARGWAACHDGLLCIAGSIFLAGEAIALADGSLTT